MGDLAGHHINFVGIGDGDDHIGVFCAGFKKNVGVRGLPCHGANINLVLQGAELITVGIDHHDIVLFICHVLSKCAAYLTCTENNNFHGLRNLRKYSSTIKKSLINCKYSLRGIMHIVEAAISV